MSREFPKSKNNSLKRTYGITLDQYNELRRKQKYCCAVCRRHEDEFATALAVDHCHRSREIYGLLCSYCNRYRVGRSHDYEMALRIARYLKRGTGWIVPPKKKKTRKLVKRI